MCSDLLAHIIKLANSIQAVVKINKLWSRQEEIWLQFKGPENSVSCQTLIHVRYH